MVLRPADAAQLIGRAPGARCTAGAPGRLVARNAKGVRRGADRTFKTQRQPLGLALATTPNPVRPGGRTLIAGTLSGTGSAERQIVLQSNPFPYTQGFQPAADVHLTNRDGSFSFPILGVSINTQYRVVLPNAPAVASPIVSVGVAPKVTVKAKRVRLRRGGTFRVFAGTNDGDHVESVSRSVKLRLR